MLNTSITPIEGHHAPGPTYMHTFKNTYIHTYLPTYQPTYRHIITDKNTCIYNHLHVSCVF